MGLGLQPRQPKRDQMRTMLYGGAISVTDRTSGVPDGPAFCGERSVIIRVRACVRVAARRRVGVKRWVRVRPAAVGRGLSLSCWSHSRRT